MPMNLVELEFSLHHRLGSENVVANDLTSQACATLQSTQYLSDMQHEDP